MISLFLVLLREHEPAGILFLAVSEVASCFLTSCLSGNALDMNRLVVYYNSNEYIHAGTIAVLPFPLYLLSRWKNLHILMMSPQSCRCVKGSDTPVLMGRISGRAIFSAPVTAAKPGFGSAAHVL